MSHDLPRYDGPPGQLVQPPRSRTAALVMSSIALLIGVVELLIAGWYLMIASAVTGPDCRAADSNASAGTFFHVLAGIWCLPAVLALIVLIRARSRPGVALPITVLVIAVLMLLASAPLVFVSLFAGDAC